MAKQRKRSAPYMKMSEQRSARKPEPERVAPREIKAAAGKVAEAKHVLDRMPFWSGLSMLMLATVMYINGIDATLYMGCGLCGVLAMMLE